MKYAIDCNNCGTVELSQENYQYQMSRPNMLWQCPKCRGNAMWNEEVYESNFDHDDDSDTDE